MSSVNLFIKENVQKIAKSVYVTPEIPEKKLNNVITTYKCEDYKNSILAIYDNTLLGSAKEGLVFTGERFLFNNGSVLLEFFYKDISSVKYVKSIVINNKGKEEIEHFISVSVDNKEHKLEKLGSFNYQEFEALLNNIIRDFEAYQEEDQLKTIAEMPEELKIAYIKVLINMTFSDDEKNDDQELAEILALMTKLDLKSTTRFEIRKYLTEISKENIEQVKTLIDVIKSNSESSHHKSIIISLVKDMINIYSSTKNIVSKDFDFLNTHKELFNISEEEIDLVYKAIENDYKILNEDLDDDAITKNLKELASKAASVGAPLGAVYLSGSVLGMSAAGMTSGLASLGMGGALGLSSMATGIGVAVILGVGVYKGMQHLTGANKLTKYTTRSLMLQGAIKQTQKTISLVIKDINYLIKELNNTILNHENSTEKMKKLENMVSQFASALKQVDNKSNQFQNSSNRLKCPKKLDEPRLKTLTEESTKKPLYDYIIDNYEENTFLLKENIETEVLEKMDEIFTAIGYFEVTNAIKGKASEGFDKLKGFIN
ncbi:MAG: hypothetical protein KA384_09675 [Leptotrichiaceae bacterium]|nr:hypothetical protein [Leptotrichiaceae bacterium]